MTRLPQCGPRTATETLRLIRTGDSKDRALEDKSVGIHHYGSETSQHLQEHLNPLLRSQNPKNLALQPSEWPVGDSDFVARANIAIKFLDFALRKRGLEFLDNLIGHLRKLRAKMNDRTDARGVSDALELDANVKLREKIVRKKRLNERHRSPAGGLLNSQTRTEDLHTVKPTQVGGGDVLALRMGADAKPRPGNGWRRTGKILDLNVHAKTGSSGKCPGRFGTYPRRSIGRRAGNARNEYYPGATGSYRWINVFKRTGGSNEEIPAQLIFDLALGLYGQRQRIVMATP